MTHRERGADSEYITHRDGLFELALLSQHGSGAI
jgi:hypothetical protein